MNGLSIIIPVLNEENTIGSILGELKSHQEKDEIEIIVVDGGSTDKTFDLCKKYGITPIKSEAGRARQMNKGAEYASHELLLFIHADSKLPANYYSEIQRILRQIEAGCFRLAFDEASAVLSFYAYFTRFKIKWFRFGDQGLFIRKEFFFSIGSFDSTLRVMEDQEIYTRILKEGDYEISTLELCTSARKYRKIGELKTQVIFAIIMALFYLGVKQEVLHHFHRTIFSD